MDRVIKHASWGDIEYALRLAGRMQCPFGKWSGIAGVTRGGLIPAVMLSHSLKVERFTAFHVSRYTGTELRKGGMISQYLSDIPNDGMGWLFVDDIVDSGETSNYILERFPKARFTCLFVTDNPDRIPYDPYRMHYGVVVPQNQWTVFPWENFNG